MVGSAVFAANRNNNQVDVPATSTPTATASASPEGTTTPQASETPAGTATPDPKKFSKAEQVIDAEKNTYTATIKTDKGDIVIALYADKAPRTVNNFVFLAQKKYFDGITFHRVVADFVVQGGDPTGTGSGGPGYVTQEDPNDLLNKKGMLSMAKAGAVTNFGSQFFINLKDNPGLDTDTPTQKRFYPFAEVTTGMDVVAKIAKGDVIRSVTITTTPK
ncbi:MAG: peptidylprolyl isomerase [Chloroflexi bacterium]|nr:peptidylprolyl isomerase [Chloroflexota bacterium]